MKSNAMLHGIGELLLIIILPVLLTSCLWRSPVEVVIADEKKILAENPLIIKCEKPIYRSRNSAAIHFSTIQRCFLAWENNRGGMDFLNGRKVFLNVILIDSNGNSYTNNSGGMAGDSFVVSFSNLSTKTKIVEIRITSSADFCCSKIVWYCFDPV